MVKHALFLAMVAACGSSPHGGGDDGLTPDAHEGSGSGSGSGSGDNHLTVFTIVLENHDYKEIIGSANAPYINSLLAQAALATNYKDTNHPSLPNYLHMISGADQYPGFLDVGPQQIPYFPAAQPNLATQLEAANIPWRSYQEGIPTPCSLTDSGNWATKHDPFLYFTDQQSDTARCADTNVEYATQFPTDLAAGTYRYMWITPNLIHDGHDPSTDPVAALVACDQWMATEVPKILASDAYQNGGILMITWDEAEGRNGDSLDQIPMIVMSKDIPHPGSQVATAFTHSSYLATIEDLFNLPRLATVTTTQNLMPMLQ
ncbi:MAG TPA: alkaline phosphatase family protein [Kofleriaceae bacterium]|nr:alkaline phosphatase family protein [Kofleriaceae bacterium]